MNGIYLDYHSSKPTDKRVLDEMMPYFTEMYGNPSSLHKMGDLASDALDVSRKQVADFINADEDEIIFTGSATEAINMALIGYAMKNKRKGKHIVITEVEHISVRNVAKYLTANGFDVSRVPVDQYGRVPLDKLERRIREDTILISVIYANNEIGTIQPIKAIGEIAADNDIAFYSDAVAAEGLIPLDVRRDGINLMSLSANDLYGPRGVGALYMQKRYRVNPVIIGGGQERGLRSGSEDIPGIVGMGAAAELMEREMPDEVKRLRAYRDRTIESILQDVPDAYLNGHPTERLASNSHFRFDGIEGEALLLSFKDHDIAVSTGSACTSKTLEPSHTLIATGLTHEEAHGSLQLTSGRFTKDADIDRVIEVTPEIVSNLRKLSPIYREKKVFAR
ncbi:cysteine desulfurase [Candidatus Thorarchaeota archaeon]|nr:MAG: cysteine desulfurase [Candidatus Thorarchaeota archaeon]